MRRTVVRYKAKPDLADENQRLIESVFRELAAKAPSDVRYLALRLPDGAFVHIAEAADGAPPMSAFDAFRAFQGGIKERCVEPPDTGAVRIVGNYRMLGDE
jgi:hypothetical protein